MKRPDQITFIHKNNARLFLVFPILIMILAALRDFQFIDPSKNVFIGIIIVAFVLLDYQNIFYLVCFLIPLKSGMPNNYILLFSSIALLLKSPHLKKRQIIIPFIIIAYETLLDFTASVPIEKMLFLSYVFTIFFVFFLIYADPSLLDIKKACLWYGIGTLVLVTIISISSIVHLGFMHVLSNTRVGRTKVFFPDIHNLMFDIQADGFGNFAAVAFSCFTVSFYQYYLEEKKLFTKKQTLIFIGAIVVVLLGSLSLTRTFIIVVICDVFILIFGIFKYSSKKIALLSFFLFLLTGVVFLQTPNGQAFLERFLNKHEMLTGTGRTIIFGEYLTYQLAHIKVLLFGTGVRVYATMTKDFYSSTHNMVQQIIFCYGILGGVALIISLYFPVLKMLKDGFKLEIPYFIPLFTVSLLSQATQFLTPNDMLMSFPLCLFVCLYPTIREKRKINESKDDSVSI